MNRSLSRRNLPTWSIATALIALAIGFAALSIGLANSNRERQAAIAAAYQQAEKRSEAEQAALALAREHQQVLVRAETLETQLQRLRTTKRLRQDQSQRLVAISEKSQAAAEGAMIPFHPDRFIEVPFTDFSTQRRWARLMYHPETGQSRIDIAGIGEISFPRQGFPLKLVDFDNGKAAVFFRETFSNHLYLYLVGAAIEAEVKLKPHDDAEPILRDSVVWGDRLLAILYDNQRRVNELIEISSAPFGAAIKTLAVLPSVEDPAGSNYEMMPTIFMLPDRERLWLIGGTFVVAVEPVGLRLVGRLTACERAQEAVLGPEGPVILCSARDKEGPAFYLSRWTEIGLSGALEPVLSASVPYNLRLEKGTVVLSYVSSTEDIAKLFRRDMVRNQLSGVMELGTNNLEGRVAWSQVYFLNGLLDLLLVARKDQLAYDRFAPLLADVKRRLDIEMYSLNQLMASPIGLQSKAFTKNREEAIFAVQTSRLLLLGNRYRREIAQGASLDGFTGLTDRVLNLDGHIEAVRVSTGAPDEPKLGRTFLAWPKGSAFYFDGLNVPYNHQNEWAASVLDSLKDMAPSGKSHVARQRAIDIIDHFLDSVTQDRVMPSSGEWPYWWGRAARKGSLEDAVSINTPDYPGDQLIAFISFRSIDVMSVLAADRFSEAASLPELHASIRDLVIDGKVYPFVSSSFLERGYVPQIYPRIAQAYSRMTAPWEAQNAVWALLGLPLEK